MAAGEPRWEDDDEQLVADLVLLGLTRNEARLYLAAEGRPPLRAAELAELAGVTRAKAYAGAPSTRSPPSTPPASAPGWPSARPAARSSASRPGSPWTSAWSTGGPASSAWTGTRMARGPGWCWSTPACRPPSATPSTPSGRWRARRRPDGARAQVRRCRFARARRDLTSAVRLRTVRVLFLVSRG